VEIDAFPMWIDLFYNEINFNTAELTLCDSLWWYAELGYFYMEMTVAFNSCWAGIYDNFYDFDTDATFDCDLEYYHLKDLLNLNFWSAYGSWFINTCDREVPGWIKSKSAGGPRFENGVWPEKTEFFAPGEEEEEVEEEVEPEIVEEELVDGEEEFFDDGTNEFDEFAGFL